MLTVDFDRLGLESGDRLLDMGCGGGRHAFAGLRRGATVVALDYSEGELKDVRGVVGAMLEADELPPGTQWGTVNGDALNLPFTDGSFDVIVASEVLEHLWATEWAMAELVRVLRPGGRIAVTVPTELPERVCWALDRGYHDVPGGHVRIFKRRDLEARLVRAGLTLTGRDHRHGLHSPYWWIRCAGGVDNPDRFLARRYHELLVKQITDDPRWLATVDRVLNPVIGKSLVVYAERGTRR
jgi:SAM-dependent methyltransferase